VRVLITGGRHREDWWTIYDALNKQREVGPFILIHGACPVGADYWAHMWAKAHPECMEVRHPAEWRREDGSFNQAAGFERNARMVALGADLVLAFPHPEGRGTQHTVKLAREAGIQVLEL
jgi:hypothetical protein